MNEIRDLIADMVRAGIDPDLIGRTAAALADREPVVIRDEQAERRREKDRDRKRLRNSAESAESAPVKDVSPAPPSENPPQKEKTPKGVKKKNGSRLPEEFRPDIDWAVSRGLSRQDAEGQAERFANYWQAKAGAAGVKLDWGATWRNWVLGHAERVGISAPQHVDESDKWPKRLAYARKHFAWSSKEWGPMPGQGGCRAPPELIQPTDGQSWTEFAAA